MGSKRVPKLALAVVGMLVAAAMTPWWFDQSPELDESAPAETEVRPSVRRIEVTSDGREANVVRYPAEWQTVDTQTGAVLRQQDISHRYHGKLQRVGTPNETVVYLDYDGCYRKTLDGDQPAKRIIANTGKFDGLAASPEHDVVALFGRQGLNLWSITDGSLLGTVDIEAGVTAAEWSPNGQQLLLLLSHGELQIRDGRSLELVQSQSTDLNGSGHVAWAHSGQYVAAHDDFGRIVTWDLAAKHVESHSADQATLPTFVFAPRGEFLILPDASHDVWVLPTKGQDRQRRYLGTADSLVSALCLFNDGQSLLVGTAEGTLECWSTITGLPLWNRDKGMPLPDDPMDPMSPMDRTSPFAESEGACVSSAA